MALNYVSKMNLGVLVPTGLAVAASLTASIELDLTALALLTANLNVRPPSFALDIAALATLIAGLSGGIALGLPSIDFQASAVASAALSLEAQLTVPLAFNALLGGQAGIFAYAYNGITSELGGAVTAALSSSWPDGTTGAAASNALILGTVTGSVWADMLAFFGVVPPSLPAGLSYLASVNIGLLCPICIGATGPTIAELVARLDGLLALAVQLSITPPTFTTSLSLALDLKAAIQAAISLDLPGVSFQLEALAKLVATLNAHLALLVQLTLSLSGVAGMFVYTYDGPGAGLGPALTSALAGGWPGGPTGGSQANAIVLGTVQPAVWATMSTFFGGI